MSVFTVDTDAVQAAHGSTRATVERVRADSATLAGQLTQLQSSWTGAASQAFQLCAEEWRGAQLRMEQVLDSIGTALGSAATQYSDADQYSASLFR